MTKARLNELWWSRYVAEKQEQISKQDGKCAWCKEPLSMEMFHETNKLHGMLPPPDREEGIICDRCMEEYEDEEAVPA